MSLIIQRSFFYSATVGSLSVTTSSLTAGTQGSAYSQALAASGGTAPYTWTYTGSLNPFGSSPNILPTPTQALSVSYSGVVQGPLPNAETDSLTVTVRDSVGATASKALTLTANSAAQAIALKYLTGGDQQFGTAIDNTVTTQYVCNDCWDGQFGHLLNGWNSRIWEASIPFAYTASTIFGYPFANRGWYPAQANPCATVNGGAGGIGNDSLIQISALTKAKFKWILEAPIDRAQVVDDMLCDCYLYNTNVTGLTAGQSLSNSAVAISLSIFASFVDSSQYWQNMIGTKNLSAASLSSSDYTTQTHNGRVMLDNRMWVYLITSENWAAGYPSTLNTIRLFPAPWNDTSSVGGTHLYVDVKQMLTDMLANTTITGLLTPLTSSLYLGNMAVGYEVTGASTLHTITAITRGTTSVLTISTVVAANPFSIGQRVGYVGVGGTTGLNTVIGTVTAVGGSSGAWTVTTNTDSSGMSAWTSGGKLHAGIFRTLDFQTTLQTEPDPNMYVVPEIAQNVSRGCTVTASTGYGGAFVAANAVGADYNLGYQSNIGALGSGNPAELIVNLSGVSSGLKTTGIVVITGQSGNSGYQISSPQNLPGDYTIDAHATGTTGLGAGGWVNIITVTGNARTVRSHDIGNWSAYNALRIRATASASGASLTDLGIKFDVYCAPNTSGTAVRGINFVGDSVTNKCMKAQDCEEGGYADYPGNHLYNYCGQVIPTECTGISGWSLTGTNYPPMMPFFRGGGANATITFTGSFSGSETSGTLTSNWSGVTGIIAVRFSNGNFRYCNFTNGSTAVTITNLGSFGASVGAAATATAQTFNWIAESAMSHVFCQLGVNDGADGVTGATFRAALTEMVNIILAAGKIAILPSIWYLHQDSGASAATFSGYVTTVLGTFASNANVISGPDIYSWGANFDSIMSNSSDRIHPSPYGQAIYRGLEMDWFGRCVLLGQPPSTWLPNFNANAGVGGH